MIHPEIFDTIERFINDEPFFKIAISDPLHKDAQYYKITIVPHKKSDKLFYQFSLFYESKVKHENAYSFYDMKQKIKEFVEIGYQQWDIVFAKKNTKILFNKRGTHKIITQDIQAVNTQVGFHNKAKKYAFQEGVPVPWLIGLGIMNKDGYVYHEKQRKFRQINKFLEMMDNVLQALPDNPVIVDYGCGKSYLTFGLYDFLQKSGRNPTIIGIDLKKDVINNCTHLAKEMDFTGLIFQTGDMKDHNLSKAGQVNMVVSLHACDTATDCVIANAIKHGVDVIISVPCCQHELINQVQNDALDLILKHGILKERLSAILTDAIRSALLEACGYKCQVIEFIDKEDTPKNIMLRAVRKKIINTNNSIVVDKDSFAKALCLIDDFHVSPSLLRLLELTV